MSDFSENTTTKNIYEGYLVQDPCLLVEDSVRVPLYKGAAEITSYTQDASSASAAGISWNVIMPSLQTDIIPVALMEVTMTFGFTKTPTATVAKPTISLGEDESFCDYPLNSCFDNVNLTFNNSGLSVEHAQTFPILKKLIHEDTVKWIKTVPTQQDAIMSYKDAEDNCTFADTLLSFGQAESKYNRGGWIDPSLTFKGNVTRVQNVAAPGFVTVTFIEPLLVQPFGADWNASCISNINTFRIQANFIQASLMKVLRSNNATTAITSVAIDPASNAKLHLFFLTRPASLPAPSRCIKEYTNIVRSTNVVKFSANANVPSIGETTFQLNPIQLGVMPHRIVISVRPAQKSGAGACADSDFFLPISGVSLTLNNKSGLLSSCKQDQLYNMSLASGLAPVDYNIWRGAVNAVDNAAIAAAVGNITRPKLIATVGGPVVLDVGRYIAISDDSYAPGSLGNFNFFGTVTVNVRAAPIALPAGYEARNYEATVLFLNDNSLLVNEKGASSVIVGLFDRSSVLSISNQEPANKPSKKPIFGGAHWFQKAIDKMSFDDKKQASGQASGHASGRGKLANYLK